MKVLVVLDAKAFRDYVNEALDATLSDRESLWNFLRALDWLSSISLYADMLTAECFCHSVTIKTKKQMQNNHPFFCSGLIYLIYSSVMKHLIKHVHKNHSNSMMKWFSNPSVQTVYCLRRLFYMYVFHISCLTTKPLEEKECNHFICLF